MATLAETTRRLKDDIASGLRQMQDQFSNALLAGGDDQGRQDQLRAEFDQTFTRLDGLVTNINFDNPDATYPSTVTVKPERPNDSGVQPAMDPNAKTPKDLQTGDSLDVGHADPKLVNPREDGSDDVVAREQAEWQEKADRGAEAKAAGQDPSGQGPVHPQNRPYANEQPYGVNSGAIDPQYDDAAVSSTTPSNATSKAGTKEAQEVRKATEQAQRDQDKTAKAQEKEADRQAKDAEKEAKAATKDATAPAHPARGRGKADDKK